MLDKLKQYVSRLIFFKIPLLKIIQNQNNVLLSVLSLFLFYIVIKKWFFIFRKIFISGCIQTIRLIKTPQQFLRPQINSSVNGLDANRLAFNQWWTCSSSLIKHTHVSVTSLRFPRKKKRCRTVSLMNQFSGSASFIHITDLDSESRKY